jgi:hypothetical protein
MKMKRMGIIFLVMFLGVVFTSMQTFAETNPPQGIDFRVFFALGSTGYSEAIPPNSNIPENEFTRFCGYFGFELSKDLDVCFLKGRALIGAVFEPPDEKLYVPERWVKASIWAGKRFSVDFLFLEEISPQIGARISWLSRMAPSDLHYASLVSLSPELGFEMKFDKDFYLEAGIFYPILVSTDEAGMGGRLGGRLALGHDFGWMRLEARYEVEKYSGDWFQGRMKFNTFMLEANFAVITF